MWRASWRQLMIDLWNGDSYLSKSVNVNFHCDKDCMLLESCRKQFFTILHSSLSLIIKLRVRVEFTDWIIFSAKFLSVRKEMSSLLSGYGWWADLMMGLSGVFGACLLCRSQLLLGHTAPNQLQLPNMMDITSKPFLQYCHSNSARHVRLKDKISYAA